MRKHREYRDYLAPDNRAQTRAQTHREKIEQQNWQHSARSTRTERRVWFLSTAAQTMMVFPATAAPQEDIAIRFSCQQNSMSQSPVRPHVVDLIRGSGRAASARRG